MNLSQIAEGTANYLSKELALETKKIDTLRFGLEIIFAALIKGIILISLAYFLGILSEVLFAMACGAIYRLLSGGAHCEGYWRCLTLGVICYLGAGLLGLYLGRYVPADFLVYSLLAGFLISSLCVIAWVPGEVPYKKITDTSKRIMFKTLSVIYLGVWFAISVLMVHKANPTLVIAGLMAVITQTMSFSPPGYKTIYHVDRLLAGLFKERRCPANVEDY